MPATFADALAATDDVEGWMSPDQARRLFDAAARARAGNVEIGSFRGRSTIVLALGAAPGVGITAIDPHAGNDRGPQEIAGFAAQAATDNEVFNRNLQRAGVAATVRHVRAFSAAAHGEVTGGMDVLYVDGAHRYAPALADIRGWGSRVQDGGTMLIHDSFSSIGVTAAILRELVAGRRWRYVGRARSLTEYRADLAGTPTARLANAARQLAQLPWFAKNLAVKLLLAARLGPVLRRLVGHDVEWPY